MKILVFDDAERHLKAAKLTLGTDHDLTVVRTYDEAQELLTPKIDYEKAEKLFPQLIIEAGLGQDFDYHKEGTSDADKKKFRSANAKSYDLATTYPEYDAVLTDLLVPASRQAQGGEGLAFVGQEMPLGTTIALLALCSKVKMVAVATDENHHHHPASAAFDCFRQEKGNLVGGDVRILCTNHVAMVAIDQKTGELVSPGFLESDEGNVKYPYVSGTWGPRHGLEYGKDWARVLAELMA